MMSETYPGTNTFFNQPQSSTAVHENLTHVLSSPAIEAV